MGQTRSPANSCDAPNPLMWILWCTDQFINLLLRHVGCWHDMIRSVLFICYHWKKIIVFLWCAINCVIISGKQCFVISDDDIDKSKISRKESKITQLNAKMGSKIKSSWMAAQGFCKRAYNGNCIKLCCDGYTHFRDCAVWTDYIMYKTTRL